MAETSSQVQCYRDLPFRPPPSFRFHPCTWIHKQPITITLEDPDGNASMRAERFVTALFARRMPGLELYRTIEAPNNSHEAGVLAIRRIDGAGGGFAWVYTRLQASGTEIVAHLHRMTHRNSPLVRLSKGLGWAFLGAILSLFLVPNSFVNAFHPNPGIGRMIPGLGPGVLLGFFVAWLLPAEPNTNAQAELNTLSQALQLALQETARMRHELV